MASHSKSQVFDEVAKLVNSKTGVQLGSNQTNMVEFRLRKRISDLRLESLDHYLEYLKSNLEKESEALISLLTTHHTFFFREFPHFEFLEQEGLKRLVEAAKVEGRSTLKIWSAACSRGQEAYSLAMFLNVHLKAIDPSMKFEILGTDVDPNSVAVARNGVYLWDDLKGAPAAYIAGNWVRGTQEIAQYVKAKPSIKDACRFETGNLLEISPDIQKQKFDLIWCRNVLIYFNQDQVKKVVKSLLNQLSPQGVLTLGLSEGLVGSDIEMEPQGPSVYVRKGAWAPQQDPVPGKSVWENSPKPATLRVLCVDDSPSVLAVLKKLLTKDFGFEVVGTAKNGLEAAKFMKENPGKVDLMTLDIHMPEQTGIEYLEKNMSKEHPPVVMVSSVSREDKAMGMKAIELGARDFVEKPTLQDIKVRADEIRMKLKMAVKGEVQAQVSGDTLELEKSLSSKEQHPVMPSQTRRFIVMSPAERLSLKTVLKDLKGKQQPPLLIAVHSHKGKWDDILKVIKAEGWSEAIVVDEPPRKLDANAIYVFDLDKLLRRMFLVESRRETSIMILGKCNRSIEESVASQTTAQIILEDLGDSAASASQGFKAKIHWIIPRTGFGYHSDRYLSTGK